jgi:hypothetical protein
MNIFNFLFRMHRHFVIKKVDRKLNLKPNGFRLKEHSFKDWDMSQLNSWCFRLRQVLYIRITKKYFVDCLQSSSLA